MSIERKLLRSIVAMETSGRPLHLPTLMTELSVSSMEFRAELTRLCRKGYLDVEWHTTAAGRRVTERPLGKVLLRRRPKSHTLKSHSHQSHAQNAASLRRVFSAVAPRFPAPLSGAIVTTADLNRVAGIVPAIPARMLGAPRTPPPLSPMDDHEFDVRESELEELKPHY